MTTHHETRRGIAKYCANILHGNHTRKQSPSYEIYHTLAGISFLDTADRVNLAQHIIERLGLLLDPRYQVHSVVITRSNENQILISGRIERR